MEDLNKAAFELFVRQPVNREMIAFLADTARKVLDGYPAAAPKTSLKGRRIANNCGKNPTIHDVRPVNEGLPPLETFIAKLVISSNVQVSTLMSTLVYLRRIKCKLKGKASGLRCTPYRIFLASLILAGKYLNDKSPNNKQWANHTVIKTDMYTFGFNRNDVNMMEKQLLFLLEWNLQITEQDIYRELEFFLRPLRASIAGPYISKLSRCVVNPARRISGLSHLFRFPKSTTTLNRAHGESFQIRAA